MPASPLAQALFTLALAFIGGSTFAYLGVPLAWLLGALVATIAGVFSGLDLRVPGNLRTSMAAVLGVMIGATFTPDILMRLVQWWPSVLLLLFAIFLMTVLGSLYFRRIGGFDPATAYFSSAPGGLSEMALVGETFGGDIRLITLVHATRVAVVVSVVPFYFRYTYGLGATSLPDGGNGLFVIPLGEALLLLLCAAAGVIMARALRLPAPAFIGPMILSIGVHLAGLSEATPPPAFIAIAQVVLGASVGCRFTGLNLSQVWQTLVLAVGAALLFIAIAISFASLVAPVVEIDTEALVLALTPGGVVEMGLVALSLGVSTAYVTTMHILRIILLVTLMPLVYRSYKA